MNSSLLILVFSLKGMFGADLQTILRRIARNADGAIVDYAPFAPRFGLQNGVILKVLSNFVRYGGIIQHYKRFP